jgi:hypothetical protein
MALDWFSQENMRIVCLILLEVVLSFPVYAFSIHLFGIFSAGVFFVSFTTFAAGTCSYGDGSQIHR